jgi:hypothetical protein
MTLRLLLTFILAASLSGCTSSTSIAQENRNPLVASRYGDMQADTLANLFISKDPVTQQPGMKDLIEKKIDEAKTISTNARQLQQNGLMGLFIGIKEGVQGYALLLEKTLYFSSDFETKPGLNLHVYLTNAVDPRDVTFPDKTAIDLGEIQSAYGAQQYTLPGNTKPESYRTVVLWDTVLKRSYSFSQLSKQAGLEQAQ